MKRVACIERSLLGRIDFVLGLPLVYAVLVVVPAALCALCAGSLLGPFRLLLLVVLLLLLLAPFTPLALLLLLKSIST